MDTIDALVKLLELTVTVAAVRLLVSLLEASTTPSLTDHARRREGRS